MGDALGVLSLPVIFPPKTNTRFVRLKNQLALFHSESDHLSYWNHYWENKRYLSRLIAAGQAGELGEFQTIIDRFVDKEHLILEAGCGPGHLVAALTSQGYQALGIDYEFDVVQFANEQLPHENIIQGNILSLSFPAASVGCYLSIGVVEHLIDGPIPALLEARRVLRSGGVALISVPYLNPMRESYLATLDQYEQRPDNMHFHQYYYDINRFSEFLYQAGFRVLEWYPYAVQSFLVREHPLFNKIWNLPGMPYRVQKRILRYLQRASVNVRKQYGHMVMFVAQPT
jgi:SAM-dependent methyltransferase